MMLRGAGKSSYLDIRCGEGRALKAAIDAGIRFAVGIDTNKYLLKKD